MRKLAYRIHLEPEPEGGFTVTVPSLPGCVTWGEDFGHAIAMAEEAIACYLEIVDEMDKHIPVERIDGPLDAVIQVTAPAGT